MEPEKIVALLQSGDQQGAEELLRHYTPLLRYVIAPILKDPRDREECLSETAMRIWEKIGQYDTEKGSWMAWLTAIARNTALNRLRQTQRHQAEEVQELSDSGADPEAQLLRRERQKALKKALSTLQEPERNIFYRKYYYLQSTAQIAAELGTSERSVEGKLYRIKQKLRKALGGDFYD